MQSWNVPEVLRPLYESSAVLAQKMTIGVRRLKVCQWLSGTGHEERKLHVSSGAEFHVF